MPTQEVHRNRKSTEQDKREGKANTRTGGPPFGIRSVPAYLRRKFWAQRRCRPGVRTLGPPFLLTGCGAPRRVRTPGPRLSGVSAQIRPVVNGSQEPSAQRALSPPIPDVHCPAGTAGSCHGASARGCGRPERQMVALRAAALGRFEHLEKISLEVKVGFGATIWFSLWL